jgi:hypothetical protein
LNNISKKVPLAVRRGSQQGCHRRDLFIDMRMAHIFGQILKVLPLAAFWRTNGRGRVGASLPTIRTSRSSASMRVLRRRFRNGRYHRFDARLLWRQQFGERVTQFRPVKRLLQHRKGFGNCLAACPCHSRSKRRRARRARRGRRRWGSSFARLD